MSVRSIVAPPKVLPHSSMVIFLAAVSAFGCAQKAGAPADDLRKAAKEGQFTVPGVYEPNITQYDNGLTLITKHRPEVKNVAVRVNVELGTSHYPCGQQHTPHFLEHMLYSSVPGMSQKELEERFFHWGAASNAATNPASTVYWVSGFSGKAMPALELTADMMFEAQLEKDAFDRARKIIFRETGGEMGPREKATRVGGELGSGVAEALADISTQDFGLCRTHNNGQTVTLEAVRQAYKHHYVPERMTWVVVGDYAPEELKAWAGKRLADVPRGGTSPPELASWGEFKRDKYQGVAGEPSVSLLSRAKVETDNAEHALLLIQHILQNELFNALRLDEELSYAPTITFIGTQSQPKLYIVGISAAVEPENQDRAADAIRRVVQNFTDAPLEKDAFRRAKRSLLRQWAQFAESNSDYADYYVGELFNFRRNGRFVNDEVRLAAVTREDVHRIAKKIFADERTVWARDGDRAHKELSDSTDQ